MSANWSSFSKSGRCLSTAPSRIAILIAVHEPTPALTSLLERLVEAEAPAVILVDDGSSSSRQWILERAAMEPQVHLVRHARKMGRGAAIKTGIRYFLDYLGHYVGLVTADANGQHSAEDIIRVARALHRSPGLAILGARMFDEASPEYERFGVPRRVIAANRMMAFLFRAFTGVALSDARTGLRGLPSTILPRLLAVRGSGQDYDMRVLLHLARTGHPLAEQPIRMLRGAGDPDWDFRPVVDTWRVIQALLVPGSAVAGAEDSADDDSSGTSDRSKNSRTIHAR